MPKEIEIDDLKENEKLLVHEIRNKCPPLFQSIEIIKNKTLFITIKSPSSENHIEIFYDKDDIVLSIGK